MSAYDFVEQYQARIQSFLDQALPQPEPDLSPLTKAMRYSLLNGGKRIRALLVYATGLSLNVPMEELDVIAASVEMIHAFSLIHDDLPAMDDDELRRGIPTCHIAFDEATAILAGDALHTEAFTILSQNNSPYFNAAQRLAMVNMLSDAIGQKGMVQGQTIDVLAVGKQLSLEILEQMHYLKTGRLIEASIQLPTLANDKISAPTKDNLREFSRLLGIAFQIKDDLLDVTADTETLGKTAGKDEAASKPTFVSLLGLSEAQKSLKALHHSVLQTVESSPKLANGPLHLLADYIINRKH